MILAFLALQAAQPPKVIAVPPINAAPRVAPAWPELFKDMSPEGRAALQAEMEAERQRSQAHQNRLRAALERLERETQRNPLDLAAVKQAIDERDAIEIERIGENSRVAVAFLERLSPADRLIAVRALRGIGRASQRAVTLPAIPLRP